MRTMGTGRVIGALLLASASASAVAQDTTTIPAQGIDRYSLPPGNSQATPTPSPSPTPAPTPTPSATPPAIVPTAPRPRATATPAPIRVTPTPTPTPVPITRPSPTAAPAPIDTRADEPQALPAPSPTPTPAPAPTPAAETGSTPVPTAVASDPAPAPATDSAEPRTWLWWAIGLVLIAGAGVLTWRKMRSRDDEDWVASDKVAPVADLPVVTAPPTPPATVPPAPAEPAAALALDLRPQRLWTRGPNAHLAFELIVTNTGAATIESIRPVISLISAGPDTATDIQSFRANAPTMPSGEPFDLPPGKSCAIAGELTLPGDAMYVTTAADRELIVPVVLAAIGWRGGLSVARASEAFVVGTGDATSARLGPIWVDRAGLVYERLDARRFTAGGR